MTNKIMSFHNPLSHHMLNNKKLVCDKCSKPTRILLSMNDSSPKYCLDCAPKKNKQIVVWMDEMKHIDEIMERLNDR